MVTDTLELEYDYYLSLANLYDTTDLDVPWDWKNQHNNNEMPSSSTTRIGAIAESDFITECLKRNFEPHIPVTAMPWDFIVTCHKGVLKVQVKTTNSQYRDNSYNIATSTGGNNGKKHINKEVDVVACYIQPEQLWFLLPLKEVTGRTTRLSTDQTTKSKYQKYRENWSIFYE